jgi:hypothetical protein
MSNAYSILFEKLAGQIQFKVDYNKVTRNGALFLKCYWTFRRIFWYFKQLSASQLRLSPLLRVWTIDYHMPISQCYCTDYFRPFAHCLVRLGNKASTLWWMCRRWHHVPMPVMTALFTTTATSYLTEMELSWRGEVSLVAFRSIMHGALCLVTMCIDLKVRTSKLVLFRETKYFSLILFLYIYLLAS